MGDYLTSKDKGILRELGKKVFEIGSLSEMEERRRLWRKLNSLQAERPMILVETSGTIDEIIPASELCCEGDWARSIESRLRLSIFHFDNIPDDMVIEPRITYQESVSGDFYGLELVEHIGDTGRGAGSRRWDPPIEDIEKALDLLRPRQWSWDKTDAEAERSMLEDVFTGILPVEKRGWYWWSTGMTENLIKLIGLEQMMFAMLDYPEAMHRLMAFLRDDMQGMLDWYERQGLLFPNNEDDYIGSGGRGYTDLLPQKDTVFGPARIKDMWGLSESQESVGVSPEMFAEFIFPYQLPVISRFGLACYGCCEPLEGRWQFIRRIPNLRRVSVSPWANQEMMAEYLGRDYVYNRKPNPVLISTNRWDEDGVREDLRKTLSLTKGLNVDIVLKDVHTVAGQSQRFGRWAAIAREEIMKME